MRLDEFGKAVQGLNTDGAGGCGRFGQGTCEKQSIDHMKGTIDQLAPEVLILQKEAEILELRRKIESERTDLKEENVGNLELMKKEAEVLELKKRIRQSKGEPKR